MLDINVKISYFPKLKFLYLFMLSERGFTSKYGQGIIQEIVEILTRR